jgi:hypothetical protein
MSWKRLATIPLIVAANGWSWLSYVLTGFPADKEVYRDRYWGWMAEDMEEHWQALAHPQEGRFHELKNVGVEYCRAHAQPAMKSLCMFLMIGWIGWVISTAALLLSFWL